MFLVSTEKLEQLALGKNEEHKKIPTFATLFVHLWSCFLFFFLLHKPFLLLTIVRKLSKYPQFSDSNFLTIEKTRTAPNNEIFPEQWIIEDHEGS